MNILEKVFSSGEMEEEVLKDFFKSYSDVKVTKYKQSEKCMGVIYCEGMVDGSQLNDYFNRVTAYLSNDDEPSEHHCDLPPIISINSVSVMIEKVFSGFLIFFKERSKFLWAIDIANIPQRTPEESKTETSIKGPKDAFTEEIYTNISLIRKRLKSPELYNESFVIGSLSKTKVSLLYLENKVNEATLAEIKERLNKIETESILSAGQLEQWLSDRTFSLFPLFDYITRPDFTIECMLRGRFIILVDGSPMVLIGPANLTELTKSPEDIHFPYYFVMFQRGLRIIGIVIAIFLPGFWVAIGNVNVDQLPFPLLATVVVSRQGLPIPGGLEAFFILGLFELLREAGVRMPTAVGQTISIVGGLIIGDASIRAGLASPTIIVMIAVTAVATYTLVNQSLSGTVTVLRFGTLLISSFLGIYGLFISAFAVLIYLCQLESFKVSYMEPIVSLKPKEILSALLINPFKRRDLSASMLNRGKKK
ncbi:spore gernimation protein GerA [Sporosarcina globispora]|uniref:Spore gernimation protein GerA n=2 Tax=Sporosarcina globispora TaxID=1459 RepID=A0A0M0GLK3_SPOGL|nr:spore gernimation protein GerA [Sporosarcina globispora]